MILRLLYLPYASHNYKDLLGLFVYIVVDISKNLKYHKIHDLNIFI